MVAQKEFAATVAIQQQIVIAQQQLQLELHQQLLVASLTMQQPLIVLAEDIVWSRPAQLSPKPPLAPKITPKQQKLKPHTERAPARACGRPTALSVGARALINE